ncbi:MAG: VIT domain-containing protein [Planctomycetota bacterium]
MVGEKEIPLPLKHTDVKARVEAFLATVQVKQEYENPYEEKIEAVYVFPLPQDAAVTDFLLVIGDRRIRGMIREKEEAKRIYEEAGARGFRAALLTQERPNIFTQKVANIEPKKKIDVEMTYFSPLRYGDGEYEFVFPMVVGPRFNPPGSTQGVGAVARGEGGRSGQATEVEYLKPGERSGHDIALSLEIDAGVKIEAVVSRSHAVTVRRPAASLAFVTLDPSDAIPNKDFVLRYRLSGEQPKAALLTQHAEDGDYFALFLMPPDDLKKLPRIPREMVFVLDCSGSMSGAPLAKAKEAMRRCLAGLTPEDTFQIIRFSDSASSLGKDPVPATPENVRNGLAYLESLNSEGGTMAIEGIKAALDFPHDESRFRIVSFMTDGYIGNEDEILAAVKAGVGPARIFSFGVGFAVNRYLLDNMARLGRGAVAYVGLRDDAGAEVDHFYERASRPALADIQIDWGEATVTDQYPEALPDLFAGRPLLITGKYECDKPSEIRVTGREGKETISYALSLQTDEEETEREGIRTLWARCRIADLSVREISNPTPELKKEVTDTSLAYKLLCRYTAFLAVDGSAPTEGGQGLSVAVPVPVPEGVKYETTVQEQ